MLKKHVLRAAPILILLAVFAAAGWVGGLTYALDVELIKDAQRWRAESPQLTTVVIVLTHMGSAYATLGSGLLASLWLAAQRQYYHAIPLAVAVVGERVLLDGIKLMIDRARPAFDLHPVATHSASFPSGHSGNTMAVFLTIALIATPARWRRAAVAVALTLSFLIGMSRVYLGVHWPSDVVGGWALGGIVAIVATRVVRWYELRAAEQEHQIVSGHVPPLDKK